MTTKILKNCSGLNSALKPHELGDTDLAYAMDVVVTEGGSLETADSSTLTISLAYGHSLYGMGSYALCMDGGTIKKIIGATEATTIQSGFSGERMCFCRVGNMAIFTNRNERGIVQDGSVFAWEVDEYSPKNRIKTDRHIETEIPPFDFVFIHGPYLLGVIGNALFSCAMPGKYGLWDLSEPIMFASNIVMGASWWAESSQGVFISDEEETWFLRGTNCRDFVQGKPVAGYPAYPWSLAQNEVQAEDLGMKFAGPMPVWNSTEGICLGGPGFVINATKRKIVHPDIKGQNGATLLRDYRVIATVAESFTIDANLSYNNAATQRSTFNFNSYCRVGNVFLGCNQNGVYTIGGAGLTANFETAPTNFDWQGEKRVRYFELEGDFSAGSYSLYPILDGVQQSAIPFTVTSTSTIRAYVPRTIQGNWFALKVVGPEIKIDSITAQPVLLSQGKHIVS